VTGLTGWRATRPAAKPWDLLVIGGGTAGIVGAKTAASLGARVLLVERDRTGGDCLWTGCVPSKAFLAAANAAYDAAAAIRFGVRTAGIHVDFDEVMRHVRAAIAQIEPTDSPEALRQAGVHVVRGTAMFTGRTSATVDGETVHFRQALLAAGAAPRVPDIPGLAAGCAYTSDTVWALPSLPRRLSIVGGGPIGCELGQGFARLGASVSIVEASTRLLPREDPDAAAIVTDQLAGDGVTVHTRATIVEVRPASADPSGGGSLVLADGTTIGYDALVVAVGRTPRTGGVRLDLAGVACDGRGYAVVDHHLRTTNRRIWAAGDVTAVSRFTHTAGVHASLAASNAILGPLRRVRTSTVPRVTFTQPEVAAVGVATGAGSGVGAGSGARAGQPGVTYRTWEHSHVDRAVTDAATPGFTRLALDRAGRILGATIVGPRAGESLAELVVAVRHGLRATDLAGTTHAYPTYGDGVWQAAIADARDRLARPGTARALRILASVRRGWLAATAGRRQRSAR
jgi:pyruvate/2-oxoglutarate dehydrogenase complex dihydrolipoamide dehydrogenase (E3) component